MRPCEISIPAPWPLVSIDAAFEYHGRAAQAVRRLKYEGATSLIEPMADLLRERFDSLAGNRYDLIVPMPIHEAREAERGFNQAASLSEALPAERVRRDLVRRVRPREPQARLTREQRLGNWEGVFSVSRGLEGQMILLVDDVATTGSSLRAAAEALILAGASEVAALVFAYEP